MTDNESARIRNLWGFFLLRKYRRYLESALLALLLLSSFLTIKSSSDKVPDLLRGTRLEALFLQFETGNQNIHDVAVGSLTGLIIYFLVVWLPERDKRARVRRHLQNQYESFKEQCLLLFLSSFMNYAHDSSRAGSSHDTPQMDDLKDRGNFVEFFNAPFSGSQTNWHAVMNGLDAEHLRCLTVEIEIFTDAINFALSTVDVEENIFEYLKDLTIVLHRVSNMPPEYRGVENRSKLIWRIFGDWSLVHGYIKTDEIAEAIEEI